MASVHHAQILGAHNFFDKKLLTAHKIVLEYRQMRRRETSKFIKDLQRAAGWWEAQDTDRPNTFHEQSAEQEISEY